MNRGRFKFLITFLPVFISVSFLSRTVLLFVSIDQVDLSILALIKVFAIGLFYDFVAASYYMIPFVIYLILMPNKIFNSKIHKVISLAIFFAVIYSVIFNAFSEYFFWDEFGKRFNFIAVDYLVYTHEVIHNILESYPIPMLVGVIFVLTAILFFFIVKKSNLLEDGFSDERTFFDRLKIGLVYLLLPVIFFNVLDKQYIAVAHTDNKFNQELSKNGFYSLFSAFRHNELDYKEFYKTQDHTPVLKD